MKINWKTNWKKVTLVLLAFSFICWDLVNTAQSYVEEGTYRYESEFDAVTGATTNAAIVTSDYSGLSAQVSRSTNPEFNHIQEMVDKAIELQGGFEYIISKGDKVMIKVNLVGKNSPSGEGENTDVRVVKALIKNIHEYTEGDVEILVAEGTARTNDDPETSGSVWENSGYTALITDSYLTGVNFSLLNLNQSIDDLVEFDLQDKGTSAPQGTKYHVHKEQLMADVYIAVPVLKIHDTGLTNALKLQIGSAPGCYYGYNKTAGTSHSVGLFHDVDHRRWTTEAIVDLCAIADIDFVVVDAIMCLETYKTYRGNNQVRMNTIVAGADPVAIDNVCARLFYINPDDIAHITLAEKIGLGTNQIDDIHLSGSELSAARKKVKKNDSENGKWGQSNRSWILSQKYEGTSVSDAAIENEASYIPVSGTDNWTEPVYFFDDRIDLSSFYNGATDVVTYAFTKFNAPEAKTAELWLGYQEGIIVYLNGENVFEYTSVTSYSDGDIGDYKTDISLKEGENTLLVKTNNAYGDYSFALNVCDKGTGGNRVEGLTFYNETGVGNKEKINRNFKVKAYPNPCADYVNISFTLENAENADILITDISGKTITNLNNYKPVNGNQTIEWDLSSTNGNKVKAGIYLFVLQSGDNKNTKRIIIQ